jgi:hypothetical protein
LTFCSTIVKGYGRSREHNENRRVWAQGSLGGVEGTEGFWRGMGYKRSCERWVALRSKVEVGHRGDAGRGGAVEEHGRMSMRGMGDRGAWEGKHRRKHWKGWGGTGMSDASIAISSAPLILTLPLHV